MRVLKIIQDTCRVCILVGYICIYIYIHYIIVRYANASVPFPFSLFPYPNHPPPQSPSQSPSQGQVKVKSRSSQGQVKVKSRTSQIQGNDTYIHTYIRTVQYNAMQETRPETLKLYIKPFDSRQAGTKHQVSSITHHASRITHHAYAAVCTTYSHRTLFRTLYVQSRKEMEMNLIVRRSHASRAGRRAGCIRRRA